MRSNECTVFLHAKIVTGKKGGFDNLGLLDQEGVRIHLLNANFSKQDTSVAISDCVNIGVLDLYYKINCSSCGQDSLIMETDAGQKSKASEILANGYCCRHCKEFVRAPKPIIQRYAVSQKYIGGYEAPDERPEWGIPILNKLVSKFFRLFRGKDGE